jgi:hypothetical protein
MQFITNSTSHAKQQGPGQDRRRLERDSRRSGRPRRERDSEREGRKRREGGRGSAEAGRAEGQAEMKAERERKPDTQDMLEEHRSESCRGHAQ